MTKKIRETKKVFIFIVEGQSDKHALEKIFQKIYRNKNVVFKVTDGDITSDEEMDESKVIEAIWLKVDEYIKDKKIVKKDIAQIIHVFDTDGVYVPDSAIIEGNTKEFWYTTTSISCKDSQRIRNRNKQKRNLMDYLLDLQDIKGISYQGYFMSSNLDHALYDIQNLEDELKGEYADEFYAAFLDLEDKFIDFLKTDVVNGVPDSFPSSWRYIKEGVRSLERHTNLHIFFNQNPHWV